MLKEIYLGYTLETMSKKLRNSRFSIGVSSKQIVGNSLKSEVFQENENQSMILLIEAESESIALAKRLIDRNVVGF